MSDGYVSGGTRGTRKRHLCTLCLAIIPAATVADWWAWSDGGVLTTYYAHPYCTEMNATVNSWPGEVMDPSDFRAACEETWPEETFPWYEAAAT